VTQAQPQAVPGAPIHDLALVTGTTEDGDHLVFEAFGPQDPTTEAACDDTTRLWTSDPVPVAGPGFYASGEVAAPAEAGAVHWIATLTAGDGTVRDRGVCGIRSETTLVVDEPPVVTPDDPGPAPTPVPAGPEPGEPEPAGSGPLAVTGSDVLVAGAVGAALLVGGVVLVLHRVRVRRALDEVDPLV
jgi:hypothetical protein